MTSKRSGSLEFQRQMEIVEFYDGAMDHPANLAVMKLDPKDPKAFGIHFRVDNGYLKDIKQDGRL